ncbi:hypothetical protein [Clavibacter tessellarius]|uniref:hypothetical protein n=1 Tax=Clavibacter tessellarius TaxID=31965 RepID=UPI0039EB234E
MNRIRNRIMITASVFALAFSLTACSAPLPGGNGNCEFGVDYPHGSTRKAGFIDGKGKVTCTYTKGSLTDLKIESRLQRWNGSSWVTVSGSSNTTTYATVKSGVTYTGVSGFVVCQSGTFRTQSRGSGALNGSVNSSADWQTTDTKKGVKNPCSKPLNVVSVS